MLPVFDQLDLARADDVIDVFRAGAAASREAACRELSIDRIEAPGRLIATGDLHDNPNHLAKICRVAGLGDATMEPEAHVVLHEIIHSDRLIAGMDFSYRMLARCAALKAAHPEHVHLVTANHELAQLTGAGIVKHGVHCVEAFSDGVRQAFSHREPAVAEAIDEFLRAMPVALRCATPGGDVLVTHSLPDRGAMNTFDIGLLEREITDEDLAAKTGSVHQLVWGREHHADVLNKLGDAWGVRLFVLGHEHCPTGVTYREPNAVVLNSDHERGVILPIDLSNPPAASEAPWLVVPLASLS